MKQLFKNIIGQKNQWEYLLKARDKERLSHALLFTGPSGLGQTQMAWALAQVLLCTESDRACGKCVNCLKTAEKKSEHILSIEPESLFIKVESIRSILRFLSLQSLALARVVIIDSAHKMNRQAANSLLKILEEPPPNVYFILISSHLSALPLTIRSRTQIVLFSPLRKNEISHKDIDPSTETWMLQACQGRLEELDKWQENKELRRQAFAVLEQALSLKSLLSFNELADLVKDREQALFVCLCWQQILRDTRQLQVDRLADIIHADQKTLLTQLKKIPSNILDGLFMDFISAERDMKRYLDTVLIFDNLFIRIRKESQRIAA